MDGALSIRRLLFGLRPSSAYALSTRPGVQWTPDFTAGAAGLELETILNRYHHAYRATAIASGALKLVARPEEVRNPRQAWAALALECADAVYVWRRTRTWQSMLDPWVTSADAVLGVASVALGSRAMHVQPQVNGTAWTNRMLAVRVAAFPLGDRHGLPLFAGVGSQVLPHLMRRDREARRRIISHLTPLLTSAFFQALMLSHEMRRAARVIDARALRWADAELDAALVAEEAHFLDTVLAPSPQVLDEISSLLVVDRAAAVALAAAEECRIRSWLTNEALAPASPSTVTPEARAAHLEIVEAGIRRLSRRLRGGIRLGSSVADLVRLVGVKHHHPGAAKVAAGVISARGLLGAALFFEWFPGVDEETSRLVESAADVLVTAAAGLHQHAERHDPPVVAWFERLVYEVSATSAAAIGRVPTQRYASHALSAIRAVVAVADRFTPPDPDAGRRARARRTVGQRLAAAANEVAIVQATSRQVEHGTWAAIEQSRQLTLATLEVEGHWSLLDDLRVRHRSFVHNGIAQVLTAVSAGRHDDPALLAWLHQERVRIDVRLGRKAVGEPGDLEAIVAALVDRFAERGAMLMAQAYDLPAWTSEIGGTVGEIITEAVNNVVKHVPDRWTWLGILDREDGTVLVRICDFGTDFPVFLPGSGTGTETMQALAAMIDADIEWFQTSSGGTEVRIVLRPPTGPMETHASAAI